MNIYSSEQLYQADQSTTQKEQITSLELMERAAGQLFNWMHQRLQGAQVPIHIFCGIGNNGGDGLALGRMLINHGYRVKIYIANFTDKRSKCFLENYDRVKKITKDWPVLMTSEKDFPAIQPDDIIVDCIFGIGLNRAPEGWVKSLIQYLNSQKAFRLSVDIPSGLAANAPLLDPEAVVQANHTLTFQAPKLAFFLPETGVFVPYFEVLDIGLDREYLASITPIAQLMYKPQVQHLYKQRRKYSHKGDYGHALIIGGSKGKMGAVGLSAKGCLKVGAGLVTTYIPEHGNPIIQSSIPEIMTLTDRGEDHIEDISYDFNPTAIVIGMGLGQHQNTAIALAQYLDKDKGPMVLDADALNVLSNQQALLSKLPAQTILTPHPGELKRLIGDWENDFQKIEKVKEFSKEHQVIMIVKGAHTLIVFEDQLYVNTTGNPGMATAGSGDVLSGMIAGLLAQDYPPLIAAIFGVYLHGSAGNIASQEVGFEALIASDIISNIGNAFLQLFQKEEVAQEANQES